MKDDLVHMGHNWKNNIKMYPPKNGDGRRDRIHTVQDGNH